MWRPDRTAVGPTQLEVRDIGALNRLFSEAFTERYRRDGLQGVRVPHLNPDVWRYALDGAGPGAMAWRDARGDLVAFNLAHRSGAEGWMGPLAVRTDRQGGGLGREVVTAGITALREAGAHTIGLETMPRTLDNIGFYSRLGFRPGPLTITLQGDVAPGLAPVAPRLGDATAARRAELLDACRVLTTAVVPDVNFTREMELTLGIGLGDVSLVHDASGALVAFALWHAAPLAAGRVAEDLRVLKLVARDLPAARRAIAAAEAEASHRGLVGCTVRCQTRHLDLYGQLITDGWRVQWTDLRLTLQDFAEVAPAGILLSNWEI
jgi:GNAT superfamily N-acetyltransferase